MGEDRVQGLAFGSGKVIVGMLHACYSQSDPDGSLTAYDAATGRLVWSTFIDPAVYTVNVTGGTILVGASDAASDVVSAYSLDTGAHLWTRQDCSWPSNVGIVSVAGKVATSCGVLDIANGRTSWRAAGVTFSRGDSPGAQNPQVYGNLGNGSLVAYRPDGTKAWTSASSRQVLAAGPSRLIAKCSEGPGVCAVDRATGVRVWRRANVTPTTATLVGAGLLIVNRGPENSAAAFNAANGQPVSMYTVAGKVDSKFQASNGRLIEETGRVLTVYAPTRPWWQTRAVSRRPP